MDGPRLLVAADRVGIGRCQQQDEFLGTLGVQVVLPLQVTVELLVEEVDDRLREIALQTLRVLDPDHDLVLLGLVEPLDQRCSGLQLNQGVTQLSEIRLLAELDGDLGATHEVDPQIEARPEELIEQPRGDDQHRDADRDLAVAEERNVGVADDAHLASVTRSTSGPARRRRGPACRWSARRRRR